MKGTIALVKLLVTLTDCLAVRFGVRRSSAQKHGLTAEMSARFDMLLQCGF